MMELGLPGSCTCIRARNWACSRWRTSRGTAWRTRPRSAPTTDARPRGATAAVCPLPWSAADEPTPAPWDAKFGTGASFGFSPATRPDGTPAADPHLPQPLWYKDFAADVRIPIRTRCSTCTAGPSRSVSGCSRRPATRRSVGSGSPSSATRPARWWAYSRVSADEGGDRFAQHHQLWARFRRTAGRRDHLCLGADQRVHPARRYHRVDDDLSQRASAPPRLLGPSDFPRGPVACGLGFGCLLESGDSDNMAGWVCPACWSCRGGNGGRGNYYA